MRHALSKLVISLFRGNWFIVVLIFARNSCDDSTFTSLMVYDFQSIPFNTQVKPKSFPMAQLLFGLLGRVETVPLSIGFCMGLFLLFFDKLWECSNRVLFFLKKIFMKVFLFHLNPFRSN